MQFSGLFHLHLRKRQHKELAPFPHPHLRVRTLDHITLAAGIIGPFMNIPQVVRIFVTQSAGGVSIISFSLFALFNIPWMIYGAVHRERAIFWAQSFWFLTNLMVVAGVIIY